MLLASGTHSPYPSQEGTRLRPPRDARLLLASSDNAQSVEALRTSPLEGSKRGVVMSGDRTLNIVCRV